jgi:hypothetical protein
MASFRHDVSFVVIVVVLGLAMVGCGSGKRLEPVAGKVTFEGKPVAKAQIRFVNREAAIDMMAVADDNGVYKVVMAKGAGLPVGEYRVAVMPPVVDVPIGQTARPMNVEQRSNIPDKYRRPETSGLALTVKPGDNVLDVDMQP